MTAVVHDAVTAVRVVQWLAARYDLPARSVTYAVGPRLAWLQRGDVVTLTDAEGNAQVGPVTEALAKAVTDGTIPAKLAAQAPWWEPGTRGSYHASSFGHLVGELVRRASGQTISQFMANEIAGPLELEGGLERETRRLGAPAFLVATGSSPLPPRGLTFDDLQLEEAGRSHDRLGAIDVGHGHGDELELHVHGSMLRALARARRSNQGRIDSIRPFLADEVEASFEQAINARDRIRIGASGKIATAFDMARAMATRCRWPPESSPGRRSR